MITITKNRKNYKLLTEESLNKLKEILAKCRHRDIKWLLKNTGIFNCFLQQPKNVFCLPSHRYIDSFTVSTFIRILFAFNRLKLFPFLHFLHPNYFFYNFCKTYFNLNLPLNFNYTKYKLIRFQIFKKLNYVGLDSEIDTDLN